MQVALLMALDLFVIFARPIIPFLICVDNFKTNHAFEKTTKELAELKHQFEIQLISEEEYNEKKQNILSKL